MSFLPAVQREIQRLLPNDPIRITLEYMSQRAVGHRNPIPLHQIVAHLRAQGIQITNTGFQQTVLAGSRSADYFIGSGSHGYFLIDTIDDAIVMRDFYETRIQAELQNLANLRRQARLVNWNI
ncbi:MAG TPA: hypothetical protein VFY06_12815 [Verrucomicrobiae bacterium]|nr:hypothetical protein [Verrucomicrobiae bacterium]